jgi:hypothetical protein
MEARHAAIGSTLILKAVIANCEKPSGRRRPKGQVWLSFRDVMPRQKREALLCANQMTRASGKRHDFDGLPAQARQ